MQKYLKPTEQRAGSSVMEAETIQKNAASPKSPASRENVLIRINNVIIVLLFIFTCIPAASAQLLQSYSPVHKAHSHMKPIQGGEKGKNYAIIIDTSLSKKDLVDRTTKFLAQWELVNLEDVKLDEISDEQAEYPIGLYLRQSFAGVSFMMGSKIVYPPVKLFGSLRFVFQNDGRVTVIFENFVEEFFILVDENTKKLENYEKEKTGQGMIADYYGHYTAAQMENSFMTTALIVLNKGLDGLKEYSKKIDDYFADVDSKFEFLEQVEKAKKGAWLSDKLFFDYAQGVYTGNYNKEVFENLKFYFDEGRILAVPQRRWEEKFIPLIDELFKMISISLEGNIDAVGEDGIDTYKNIDGSVVPVDPKWKDGIPPTNPKEREAYVKKNSKKLY